MHCLCVLVALKSEKNLFKINPTHDFSFRTEPSQMNQSVLAHCGSVLISSGSSGILVISHGVDLRPPCPWQILL